MTATCTYCGKETCGGFGWKRPTAPPLVTCYDPGCVGKFETETGVKVMTGAGR